MAGGLGAACEVEFFAVQYLILMVFHFLMIKCCACSFVMFLIVFFGKNEKSLTQV